MPRMLFPAFKYFKMPTPVSILTFISKRISYSAEFSMKNYLKPRGLLTDGLC